MKKRIRLKDDFFKDWDIDLYLATSPDKKYVLRIDGGTARDCANSNFLQGSTFLQRLDVDRALREEMRRRFLGRIAPDVGSRFEVLKFRTVSGAEVRMRETDGNRIDVSADALDYDGIIEALETMKKLKMSK